MPHYTCDPNLELNGQTTLALLQNINQDATRPYLAQHGLDNIDPEAWYPVQSILDVLNDVATEGNPMSHFVAIGIKAAELGDLPPNITFEKFIQMYGEVFLQRHRNGDPGTIESFAVGPNHMQVNCDVVYPDHVMYGLIFGYARRILSDDRHYTVFYDEEITPRDLGGEQTIIHITWE